MKQHQAPVMYQGNPDFLVLNKSLSSMSQAELKRELNTRLNKRIHSDSVKKDSIAVIRELELHQLELEIQNRELLQSYHDLELVSQKYVDLYENAPVGYVSLDVRGKIFELNTTTSKILAMDKDKLIGSSLSRWVSKEHKIAFMGHLQSCLNSESEAVMVQEVDFFIHGSLKTSVEIHSEKIHEPQFKKYFIRMTLIDISARKKVLQHESKLKEMVDEKGLREHFVSTLSHDLRAPLTSSKLCFQMLERENLSAETKERISTILISELERADRMIKDLLDANRIHGAKNLPLIRKKCDLARIAEEVIQKYRLLERASVFESEIPSKIIGIWSKNAIERILDNLLSNAVKYGAAGLPIKLSLTEDSQFAYIKLHNHGKPIPKGDQELIFQAFHRCESALDDTKIGWGLGLNLVNHLVKRHEGKITVESTALEGTTFIVSLPFHSTSA